VPGEWPKGWTAARFQDAMRFEGRGDPTNRSRLYELLGVKWCGNGPVCEKSVWEQGCQLKPSVAFSVKTYLTALVFPKT